MAAVGGQGTEVKEGEDKVLWGAKILWPPDMPDDILERVVQMAHSALEEYPEESGQLKDGMKMKSDLDNEYGPYWHVTVGKNFGSYAVHEKQRFTYFYISHIAFMVYKGGC